MTALSVFFHLCLFHYKLYNLIKSSTRVFAYCLLLLILVEASINVKIPHLHPPLTGTPKYVSF